jgi:hypothetical protein
MDPALREYLDRMELNSNNRADSILATQHNLSQQISAQSAQLRELADWRPDLEARLTNLQGVVADLQRDAAAAAAATQFIAPPPVPDADINGQLGHGVHVPPGGCPAVNSTSPSTLPVTGMHQLQDPLALSSTDPNSVTNHVMAAMGTNAPSMHFPQFTGENPNLWKTLVEQYFSMFSTHESFWVPLSTLHFKGAAGIWLQAVHKRLQGLDWTSFTSLLSTRFGRARHQLLIRQFYAIKQTTSVAEYIERFDILMNHLMSYHEDTHPFYFLTRFIEGLRSDIRAIIMIQRPSDLDSACSLALLQEEVVEGEQTSPPRHSDQRYVRLPLKPPALPYQALQSRPPSRADDSRTSDSAHSSVDEHIQALHAFRRAKGLCYRCGEKWSNEHTCPATIQLHVVEELFALFSTDELTGADSLEQYTVDTEQVCSISIHALTGSAVNSPRVIQLQAFIEDKEILLLVDSGSSTSFINQQLAGTLQEHSPCPSHARSMWLMVHNIVALSIFPSANGLYKIMCSVLT